MIKLFSFCFLDAENGTITLIYLFSDGIAFIFKVYSSDVPISAGTTIVIVGPCIHKQENPKPAPKQLLSKGCKTPTAQSRSSQTSTTSNRREAKMSTEKLVFLPQVFIKQNPKTTIEKIAQGILTIKPIQHSITAGCCRAIPDKIKVDKQTIH
jgi:hypothetical protein